MNEVVRFVVSGESLHDPATRDVVQKVLGELAVTYDLRVTVSQPPILTSNETWEHHPQGFRRADFDRLLEDPEMATRQQKITITQAFNLARRTADWTDQLSYDDSGQVLIPREVVADIIKRKDEKRKYHKLGPGTLSVYHKLLDHTRPAEEPRA